MKKNYPQWEKNIYEVSEKKNHHPKAQIQKFGGLRKKTFPPNAQRKKSQTGMKKKSPPQLPNAPWKSSGAYLIKEVRLTPSAGSGS